MALIKELAEYEHLAVVATESDFLRDGFGANPKFRALIAEWDGKPAGYAMFYDFYSSFQGRCGLFLEDIYVRTRTSRKGNRQSVAGACRENCAAGKLFRHAMGSFGLEPASD